MKKTLPEMGNKLYQIAIFKNKVPVGKKRIEGPWAKVYLKNAFKRVKNPMIGPAKRVKLQLGPAKSLLDKTNFFPPKRES